MEALTAPVAAAMLDGALAAYGTPCTLRRYVGLGSARDPVDIAIRAHVRGYAPEDLVGGIMQGDTKVILSPTEITAASWPGPQDWPQVGDRLVVDGRERNIQRSVLYQVAGGVARIELQVRG